MDSIEIYVSTDIEVDGPIPGPHSMLSLGSAAFDAGGALLATYSANLCTLPGASGHPATMDWWARQPAAWTACRTAQQEPETAMRAYAGWLKQLPGKPVFVGYPAAFDFMFVYWYLMRFAGESPFEHSALDIRSYAMALLKKPYRQSGRAHMPKRWLEEESLTHVALDDAILQGKIFCRMLQEEGQP